MLLYNYTTFNLNIVSLITTIHIIINYLRNLTTPNPPTNIVDFRGFDSSTMLLSRGGILRYIGNFPESLSQAMLVGTMLVGRSGV